MYFIVWMHEVPWELSIKYTKVLFGLFFIKLCKIWKLKNIINYSLLFLEFRTCHYTIFNFIKKIIRNVFKTSLNFSKWAAKLFFFHFIISIQLNYILILNIFILFKLVFAQLIILFGVENFLQNHYLLTWFFMFIKFGLAIRCFYSKIFLKIIFWFFYYLISLLWCLLTHFNIFYLLLL